MFKDVLKTIYKQNQPYINKQFGISNLYDPKCFSASIDMFNSLYQFIFCIKFDNQTNPDVHHINTYATILY